MLDKLSCNTLEMRSDVASQVPSNCPCYLLQRRVLRLVHLAGVEFHLVEAMAHIETMVCSRVDLVPDVVHLDVHIFRVRKFVKGRAKQLQHLMDHGAIAEQSGGRAFSSTQGDEGFYAAVLPPATPHVVRMHRVDLVPSSPARVVCHEATIHIFNTIDRDPLEIVRGCRSGSRCLPYFDLSLTDILSVQVQGGDRSLLLQRPDFRTRYTIVQRSWIVVRAE